MHPSDKLTLLLKSLGICKIDTDYLLRTEVVTSRTALIRNVCLLLYIVSAIWLPLGPWPTLQQQVPD